MSVTLIESEKTNVYDLSVAEPKEQDVIPFLPRRDITREDWEIYERHKNSPTGSEIDLAALLKVTTGKSAKDLGIVEPDWDDLRHRLKEATWEIKNELFFNEVALYNTLFPGSKNFLSGENLAWVKDRLGISSELDRSRHNRIYMMVGLFPNEEDPKRLVEADDTLLVNVINGIRIHSAAGDIVNHFDQAAKAKIIFKDLTLSYLDINDETWSRFHQFVINCRKTEKVSKFFGAEIYFETLRNAAILSAKQIVIDKFGIHLIHEEKGLNDDERPILPEVRSFR